MHLYMPHNCLQMQYVSMWWGIYWESDDNVLGQRRNCVFQQKQSILTYIPSAADQFWLIFEETPNTV